MRTQYGILLSFLTACGEAPPAQATAQESSARDTLRSSISLSAPRSQLGRSQVADSLNALRHSAIVEAAGRVAPAVVSVNVTRRQRQRARSAFDFFFIPRGYEREVQGLGSGFVVSSDGVVITNQHVTAGAEQIVVTTQDGTDYDAELLGEDPLTDIAVLRIEGSDLPTAPLGISSDLLIGEWVVAIGNPYGYLLGNTEPTVTAGVVSAVGRNLIPSGDAASIYVRMIQTDAPINPGNSGGPLVNALGEVVGVNSSIFSRTGGSVGIGFAIPIERAIRVANELRAYGSVRRAWIGVEVPGSERLREWKQLGGLEVLGVAPESPANQAGIQQGDILLIAGGYPIRTFLDWEAVKLDVGPGDMLPVTVRRDGRDRELHVRVGDLPTSRAERIEVLGGLQLITVTPAIRQERGVRSESGALIFDVDGLIQRRTSLRPGDVIIQINRRRVSSADDAREALRAATGGWIRVVFERGGGVGYTDFYVRR